MDIEKKLENIDLSRKTVVRSIVFVGHVDAGKSTVCGRLLVDLNLIEERILEKYKKEAQSVIEEVGT